MNAARQYAYRSILYWAMALELRANNSIGFRWNPWSRREASRRIARQNALADCMHNLAEFSRRDFEGFDEERFWREYGDFELRFPGSTNYRRRFEDELARYDVRNR